MRFKVVIEFDSDDLETAEEVKELISTTVDYSDLLPEGATVDLLDESNEEE
jgi:hypothetical protein